MPTKKPETYFEIIPKDINIMILLLFDYEELNAFRKIRHINKIIKNLTFIKYYSREYALGDNLYEIIDSLWKFHIGYRPITGNILYRNCINVVADDFFTSDGNIILRENTIDAIMNFIATHVFLNYKKTFEYYKDLYLDNELIHDAYVEQWDRRTAFYPNNIPDSTYFIDDIDYALEYVQNYTHNNDGVRRMIFDMKLFEMIKNRDSKYIDTMDPIKFWNFKIQVDYPIKSLLFRNRTGINHSKENITLCDGLLYLWDPYIIKNKNKLTLYDLILAYYKIKSRKFDSIQEKYKSAVMGNSSDDTKMYIDLYF